MKIVYTLLFLLFILPSLIYSQQNCILIIVDDVSPDYFSCFSKTTDTAKTPQINQLAAEGMRFTNVWANPVCSPTRAGMITGRYSFRTGVGEVVAGNLSAQLDTAEVTVAKILKTNPQIKYHTACVGKWHLHNNTAAKRTYPNKMGFDYYSGNFLGSLTNYYEYPIVLNGLLDTARQYATTQTVNDAINWLDQIPSSEPFFIWMAFNAAHTPFHLPPAQLCDVTGLSGTSSHINANKSLYFKASLQALDTEIGRLLYYLKNKGQLSNTNIILIADNGNAPSVAQNGNASHSKNTLYNYGVHVPLIVNGPSVVAPGTSSTHLINLQDLFATILELCGITFWQQQIPQSTSIDSKSFYPYLKNELKPIRNWIFSEQFQDSTKASDGKTIRNNDYQLIRFDLGTEEFYNLTTDPKETVNLLSQSMTNEQRTQYYSLCDSLNLLINQNPCSTVSTEAVNDMNFKFFPNPISDQLCLEINNDLRFGFQLYNNTGSKLSYGELDASKSCLEFNQYPDGIYFLRLSAKGEEIILKIVK
ncbi:MAG TPA: sulfatase-like hydrolase/transferase [Saprospiraceae bacterium]|nr:sulfatase-like hydrolase/transferase [Saprospiraceae bacterium]